MRYFEDLITGNTLSTENEVSAQLMAENPDRYKEVEKSKSVGKNKGAGKSGKKTDPADVETSDTGSGE